MESKEQTFDASDELACLNHAYDYRLGERTWYHLCRAVPNLETIGVSVWTIRALPQNAGCVLHGYGRKLEYRLEIVPTKDSAIITLSTREGMDEADQSSWNMRCNGPDHPQCWQSLLEKISELEDVGVFLGQWAVEVEELWDEYLRIRGDNLGF